MKPNDCLHYSRIRADAGLQTLRVKVSMQRTMIRRRKAVLALLALLACSTFAGERTFSELAFTQYCKTNSWYFSKTIALPATVAGFERLEFATEMQAFFRTSAGSDLTYSEYEIIKVKAVEITGVFTRIEGEEDIFECVDDCTQSDTNAVLLMAAFDSRLLQVESRNSQRGKVQALADAASLARLVLHDWKGSDLLRPNQQGYQEPAPPLPHD